MAANQRISRRRRARPTDLKFPHFCYTCQVNLYNEAELQAHVRSDIHILTDSFHNHWSFFNTFCHSDQLKITARHSSMINYKFNEMKVRKNVNNIITLELESVNKSVSVLDVCCLYQDSNINISFKRQHYPLVILKGEVKKTNVAITVLGFGSFSVPIAFYCNQHPSKCQLPYCCIVLRFVTESELSASLAPTTPYKPLPKKLFVPVREKISGPKMNFSSNGMESSKMKEYLPPSGILALVQSKLMDSGNLKRQELICLDKIRNVLGTEKKRKILTMDNYVKFFTYLLYIEEVQECIDLDMFSQNGIYLTPVNFNNCRYLQLEVGPGLSEGRPSIMVGDKVLVKPRYGEKFQKGWYIGIVTKVLLTSVYLLFRHDFHVHYKPSTKVDVKFEPQRMSYRLCHRALEIIKKKDLSFLLFPPKQFPFSYGSINKKLQFVNKKIELNPEQMQAVINIVHRSALPYPYLVMGPPGTGKTVTLVEAILQNYLFSPDKIRKQLVCASSNAAADVITERLIKAGVIRDNDIFRMYSPSIKEGQLSDIIKQRKECHNLCYNSKDDSYSVNIPNIEIIMNKAVVITTLITAGRLVSGMIPSNHFSHVLIDEAGHSMEPECLVPIIGIVTGHDKMVYGQVVLAGDPQQLGPVLTSVAKDYGLQISLLERLMNTQPIYQKDPKTKKFNEKVVTKLVRNFRSHQSILKLPNKLFYENELKTMGAKFLIDRFSQWNGLETKGFPIIFHGIVGSETREHTSPSYFNIQEIDQVVDYLEQLIGKTINNKIVRQTDIGVISPYKKQVQKLSIIFKKKHWTKITLGSVEQLQGDEKLIIIISTVRSKPLRDDYKISLGFLKNPKRFNVAITRAQALLIIVGNPHVLESDENWGSMLRYCIRNGGYRGEPINLGDIDKYADYDLGCEIEETLTEAVANQNNNNNVDEISATKHSFLELLSSAVDGYLSSEARPLSSEPTSLDNIDSKFALAAVNSREFTLSKDPVNSSSSLSLAAINGSFNVHEETSSLTSEQFLVEFLTDTESCATDAESCATDAESCATDAESYMTDSNYYDLDQLEDLCKGLKGVSLEVIEDDVQTQTFSKSCPAVAEANEFQVINENISNNNNCNNSSMMKETCPEGNFLEIGSNVCFDMGNDASSDEGLSKMDDKAVKNEPNDDKLKTSSLKSVKNDSDCKGSIKVEASPSFKDSILLNFEESHEKVLNDSTNINTSVDSDRSEYYSLSEDCNENCHKSLVTCGNRNIVECEKPNPGKRMNAVQAILLEYSEISNNISKPSNLSSFAKSNSNSFHDLEKSCLDKMSGINIQMNSGPGLKNQSEECIDAEKEIESQLIKKIKEVECTNGISFCAVLDSSLNENISTRLLTKNNISTETKSGNENLHPEIFFSDTRSDKDEESKQSDCSLNKKTVPDVEHLEFSEEVEQNDSLNRLMLPLRGYNGSSETRSEQNNSDSEVYHSVIESDIIEESDKLSGSGIYIRRSLPDIENVSNVLSKEAAQNNFSSRSAPVFSKVMNRVKSKPYDLSTKEKTIKKSRKDSCSLS